MKRKRTIALLVVIALCLALLAGCGKKEEAPKQDVDFLLGSWFARTGSKDGVTVDAYDLFNGIFQLYFSKNGECTMSIGQNYAVVKWELTDSGVTLKGDDTYPITFPDETRKTLIIVINGNDVLMEKYKES